LLAQKHAETPFAVINADDFYGRDAFATIGAFLDRTAADGSAYGMVGFSLRNTLPPSGTVSRGVCKADANGRLVHLTELTSIARDGAEIRSAERQLTGRELVSMNMFGFTPSIFAYMKDAFAAFLRTAGDEATSEFFMPVVVNDLIAAGAVTVEVLETGSSWFGVTNPEDRKIVISRLRSLIDAGEYPETLWGTL
jgi:hypothetical protein